MLDISNSNHSKQKKPPIFVPFHFFFFLNSAGSNRRKWLPGCRRQAHGNSSSFHEWARTWGVCLSDFSLSHSQPALEWCKYSGSLSIFWQEVTAQSKVIKEMQILTRGRQLGVLTACWWLTSVIRSSQSNSNGCEGDLAATSVTALFASVDSAQPAGRVSVALLLHCTAYISPSPSCALSGREWPCATEEGWSSVKGVLLDLPWWNIQTHHQSNRGSGRETPYICCVSTGYHWLWRTIPKQVLEPIKVHITTREAQLSYCLSVSKLGGGGDQNQAGFVYPFPGSQLKESNEQQKAEKGVYLMWPHWEEEQIDQGLPQLCFGVPGERFKLKWGPGTCIWEALVRP